MMESRLHVLLRPRAGHAVYGRSWSSDRILVAVDPKHVAGRIRHEHAARSAGRPAELEDASQLRDVEAELSAGSGRLLGPHPIDHPNRRYQLGRTQHDAP